MKLSRFAAACDRHFVSDRAAADIASALLHDYNDHSNLNISKHSLIIDRYKVRREREKSRKQPNNCFSDNKIWGLSFDGRRDDTLTIIHDQETNTNHRRILRKEHISLIKELGSFFIGFITVTSEDAKTIAENIFNSLNTIQAPIKSLRAIGSDGTVVSTGLSGGIITLLGRRFGFPVHWFICMLHFIEIPLKSIIKAQYGTANGPTTFCGSITKALETCDDLPVVKFKPIPSHFPEIDSEDLSTDQKYLWDISQAISTGHVTKQLSLRRPGVMSLSRW